MSSFQGSKRAEAKLEDGLREGKGSKMDSGDRLHRERGRQGKDEVTLKAGGGCSLGPSALLGMPAFQLVPRHRVGEGACQAPSRVSSLLLQGSPPFLFFQFLIFKLGYR